MNSLASYKDKAAIVTGGDKGNLGPIFTKVLQRLEMKVFTPGYPEYDFTSPNLEKLARDIRKICMKDYGLPYVIIHNAAIDNKPETKSTLWGNDDIMRVNYLAPKYITEAFWEDMKDAKGLKQIIFIGSILGNISADHRNYKEGFDKAVDYGASKRACFAMVQNLSTRGAPFHILVNQLSFGAFDHGNHNRDFAQKFLKKVPMRRFLTKGDVGVALLGLLMQTAMTGQQMLIDGGYCAW